MYVQVVFNTPLNEPLTYRKPEAVTESLIGCRVLAPLRSRTVKGIVVSETERADGIPGMKSVESVIDAAPICDEMHFKLAQWMAGYYHCSYGEALFAALPAGDPPKRIKTVKDRTDIPETQLTLNAEQVSAFAEVSDALGTKEPKAFLLYGVTGSGKTEIYLRAIDRALTLGKQSIVAIPEISLTPQTIERFERRFAGHIAVLHSRLPKTEKYRYWQRIRSGEIRIVVGARSAIFSPAQELGLIVIDEEHEGSYKSSETPRYHARQIAFWRMKQERAVLVLGSATPALETFYHARSGGGVTLLTLSQRVGATVLPKVNVIDMRTAKKSDVFPAMSGVLVEAVHEALDKKQQVILFLNRKGHSPVVVCPQCGKTADCPHCSITLTYHKNKNTLLCHYCGYSRKYETTCKECGAGEVSLMGTGTEKVESEIATLFPKARIARMDHDSTREAGAYEKILGEFAAGKTDILVGTQMISKGLHFPGVTLVGVLSADTGLGFPDFRAAERTFSLITQVSGRCGRGDAPGVVYVQTYNPDHYTIRHAQEHDYNAFYKDEIALRESLRYPPFSRLVRFVIRGMNEAAVKADAASIHGMISPHEGKSSLAILGPAPCPIAKLKKYYRWHIILKIMSPKMVTSLVEHVRTKFRPRKDDYVEIDVDPYNML
ncbi:MAG: primosomal protein N' [Spirochaetes bacterium]|nr:primosomal protein N' [Spirochaetota bacterium]